MGRLSQMKGGCGDGVVEVGRQRPEMLGVGVGGCGDGEDEGHQDSGPGEFVMRGEGKVSHGDTTSST